TRQAPRIADPAIGVDEPITDDAPVDHRVITLLRIEVAGPHPPLHFLHRRRLELRQSGGSHVIDVRLDGFIAWLKRADVHVLAHALFTENLPRQDRALVYLADGKKRAVGRKQGNILAVGERTGPRNPLAFL